VRFVDNHPPALRARLYLFIDWIVARVIKCRQEKRVGNGHSRTLITTAALIAELN